MQNLHRYLATLGMHRVRHLLMLCRFSAGGEFSCEWLNPANSVWRVTARDNQTDITAGALGKVGRKTVVFVAVFKPCVHGAHEHPVFQRCEAEVEWGEQVWKFSVRHRR